MFPDGSCDYVNEAWLEFTGRALENVIGIGWTESVHPDDLAECLRRQPQGTQGRSADIEYRLRRNDGTYRYVREHAAPLEDRPGESGGFLCSCLDVQELKDSAEQTEPFLRMMAHELRTPLSAMRMFIEVMRRTAARGTPSAPESFAKLDAQIDRLDRLVEDLSRSSHASHLELSLESLDLGDLVRRLVARRPTQRHSLLVSGADEKRWVRADRLRLEQVFTNLLDNAIKYSPRGGTINIFLRGSDGMHCVSFADPGIGVPPDEISALTRRFFRGSNAPRESYPGLGLGLSFANEIVTRHGGRLTFQSEIDKGTAATVCLPSGPPEAGSGGREPLETEEKVGEESSRRV
jgi:two-component system CheB/CheR fusion protein